MKDSKQFFGLCRRCHSRTFGVDWTRDENEIHYRVYCKHCSLIYIKGGLLDPILLDVYPVEKSMNIRIVDDQSLRTCSECGGRGFGEAMYIQHSPNCSLR